MKKRDIQQQAVHANELVPNEHGWVAIYDNSGALRYLVTSPSAFDRREYHLYEVKDGKAKLLGKGPSPAALEEKHIKRESLYVSAAKAAEPRVTEPEQISLLT